MVDESAARRSGSEVLEPIWNVTFGMAERTLALDEVVFRVRIRTALVPSAASALGYYLAGIVILCQDRQLPFTIGSPCAPAPPMTRYFLPVAILMFGFGWYF